MYRPKRGKQAQLLKCLKDHMPVLRQQKLVTPRKPIVMRSATGTVRIVDARHDTARKPGIAKLAG